MPLLTDMKPDILLSLVLRDDMDAWQEAMRRLERLEQCEALLRKPDSVINLVAEAISEQQSCSSCAGSNPTGPHCKACTNEAKAAIKAFLKAARAALEGK